MCNEQRRNYDNLLLMCGTHQTVIHNDDKGWTVLNLRELKRTHEAVYTAAIDQLRRQVGDVTDGVTLIPVQMASQCLTPLALTLHSWRNAAKRLSRIPSGVRSVLALIVAHGDVIRHTRSTRTGQVSCRSPSEYLGVSLTARRRSCGNTSRFWSTSPCSVAAMSHSTGHRYTWSVTLRQEPLGAWAPARLPGAGHALSPGCATRPVRPRLHGARRRLN